ncbi:PrsW family intramembrane metalloprotease [Microbacterium terricola]|uniref:Protease PrsW n=1 Tax=Microbacterium terricola TaxID=344163 RepID=A0ABM8DX73_9MICO|nr:PrsW family intramembrane metalloprotease [Microbacterium terricola]UYK39066.1 PrsW family glutamic-type intramembrane protease [Microbacterium terricola]BDV30224.1 protease PrsW [Microbacterium terricola]
MTDPNGPASARPSLTPPPFPSALAQPRMAGAAPIPAPSTSPAPLPVSARAGRTVPLWLSAVVVLVLVGLVAYFLQALGAAASILGMLLALLPLVGVLLAVRLVDRWEPEPRGLLALAVAWGAVIAVAGTLLVDLMLTPVKTVLGPDVAEVFTTVVQAPIVEEFMKGLGVLVIFLVGRRAFDGPVDGVVYGALVGAGFAFTENIQYFAISLISGGAAETSTTFFLRGILSPFAHVMFTAVTGFALGLAARRGIVGAGAIGPWILGMMGAAGLHALWNGSALFGDFFLLYVVLQIPLFVLFVLGILALRREEMRLTRARLGDYAHAGWFTPQEVDMLATPAGRKAALAWAKTLRGDRTPLMRGFIADATALAAARQRALTGRDPQATGDEQVLIARIAATRSALFAL